MRIESERHDLGGTAPALGVSGSVPELVNEPRLLRSAGSAGARSQAGAAAWGRLGAARSTPVPPPAAPGEGRVGAKARAGRTEDHARAQLALPPPPAPPRRTELCGAAREQQLGLARSRSREQLAAAPR